MRRFISLLGLLLYTVGLVFAKPLGLKQAKKIAQQFIQIDEEDFRATNKELKLQTNAYYIFNARADKGFVIVSGEDSLPLIVGYAEQGHLDKEHLPIQLKALLQAYETRVQALQERENDDFRSQRYFVYKPKMIVAPLVKALWGQEQPFNDKAPEMHDGVRAVSGCVATAMAQIMYYHKWPRKGQGSFSYYPKAYGKVLSVDFSKSIYQWDKMRDKYPIRYHRNIDGTIRIEPKYTVEAAEAVAKLVYDLGISVSMEFNTTAKGGSSSSTFVMAQALQKYFDYTAKNVDRSHIAYNQFLELIKRELKAKHPLMLSGGGYNTGHAWVVDGYDENDYLHCNWGWTGMANGFYSLEFMVPAQTGIGAGLGRYNDNQSIVILQPNNAIQKTISPIDKLSITENGKLAYTGKRGANTSHNLEFQLSNFGNLNINTFRGSIAIGIYDEQGNFIETQGAFHQVVLKSTQYYSDAKTAINMAFFNSGKYLLRFLCKQQGTNDWQMIEGSNTLKVEIKARRFYILEDNSKLRLKHREAPKEVAPAYTNSIGASNILIENLSNQIIEKNLGIKLRNKTTAKEYRLKLDKVKLYRFETKNFQITYDLSRLPKLEAGDYELSFEFYTIEAAQEVAKEIENPFGTYSIKILDNENVPMLRCEELSLEQGNKAWASDHITPAVIEQGALTIKPLLKNIGQKPFYGNLNYRLKKLSDGSFYELATKFVPYFSVGEQASPEKFAVSIDLKRLKLEDGIYQLYIFANQNEQNYDVWNPRLRRYTLFWVQKGTVTANTELEQAAFKVYPNPVLKDLYIQGAYEELALYTLQGERLLKLKAGAGKGKQRFDLSQLSQGLYILRLRGAKGVQTFRIYKR